MILIQQLKCALPHHLDQVRHKAAKALMIREEEILRMEILRRSLDCRKKPELYAIYALEVEVKDEQKVLAKALKNKRAKEQISQSDRVSYRFPEVRDSSCARAFSETKGLPGGGNLSGEFRPVIVGAGPAGLFCAYYLARAGRRPILLERGKCVGERQKDVETFWKTGILDPNSNVQFGEGGAGTFSDGKLNTLVKDREGRNRAVLETFVRFGAGENILCDAKPHIGTDVLARIIENLREELIRLGAEVRFESQVTDLVLENGSSLSGVVINGGETLACRELVLAIGHSARDTFRMLLKKGLPMEAKPFAVGFRVEHPQEMINESQYGKQTPERFQEPSHEGDAAEIFDSLGAASYKVTAKTANGRGVYSFCMCPGGYVVNASSEEGRLAVNGMSYSRRDGRNANSAIIVSVGPEDYPGDGPLAGVAFQRELERKAFELGGGRIPVQRFGDYRKRVLGMEHPNPTSAETDSQLLPACKGEYAWVDLSGLLPRQCNEAFVEGMAQFGRQIQGFDREDAILSGVESRTSSPVRILRDERLQSTIRGIYPCGEGAGYAGGITSAAMDGLRVAERICGKD